MNSITFVIVIVTSIVLSGCSVVETNDKAAACMIGDVTTDSSKNNTDFPAAGTGFCNNINIAAGGAAENVAKKGENDTKSE